MKNIFCYSIIVFLLLSASCKENSTQVSAEDGIVGTWLLKQTSGGISGGTSYPSGNNKYLVQMTKENNYTESRNDTITFSGAFTTYMDSTYNRNIIDFTDSKRFSLVIEKVSADSLVMWDGFIDGYSFFYIRIR